MGDRLEGKVALITGAARGQGRSHAVMMAREGADIVAIDACRDLATVEFAMATSDDLAETAELVKALDRRVITAQVDVRDYPGLKDALDQAVRQLGRLDIVVANAGIGVGGSPLEQLGDHAWNDTLDVNLTGAWKSIKAAAPHLLAGGRGGSIILTSSVAGLKAHPFVGSYVASKHAVVGLMRSFAVELGQHHIRVNAVHPTQVNPTMMMNEGTYRAFRPDLENPGPDDIAPISQMFHVLPIPWVEPEDISNAVVFLASDEARYITGVSLPIDAGCCLK